MALIHHRSRILASLVFAIALSPIIAPCADSQTDRDHDGLPNDEELLFQTDPNNPDTDGDGLLDGWEVFGWSRNQAEEPIHRQGAHPLRKDIFIEIDCMRDSNGSSQLASIVAYQAAVDIYRVFENSRSGIRLHFDLGPDILSRIPPELIEDGLPAHTIIENGNDAEFELAHRESFPPRPPCSSPGDAPDSLYAAYYGRTFRASRRNVFYYIVIAETYDTEDHAFVPGLSDGFADEAARREGLKPPGVQVGAVYYRALSSPDDNEVIRRYKSSATVLHELGHALGLGHGGASSRGRWNNVNFKPNYPSVMNYLYQLRGVDWKDEHPVLDFSQGEFFDIRENQLLEARGFGPTLPTPHQLRILRASHLDDVNAPFNIDWNQNGIVDLDYVRRDLNLDGRLGSEDLKDHDDWSKILRDGSPGIGVLSHQGCGLSCLAEEDVVRILGDFNGDRLSDLVLFTGGSMAVALTRGDGEHQIPRSKIFRESIGNWRLSLEDQIIVGAFGEEPGDKLILHRGGQVAVIDFNMQDAEVRWSGETIPRPPLEGGDPGNPPNAVAGEMIGWRFSGEDEMQAVQVGNSSQKALLVRNSDSAALLRWTGQGFELDWLLEDPMNGVVGNEPFLLTPGRIEENSGGTVFLQGSNSLAELDGRATPARLNRIDVDGHIQPHDAKLVAWQLSPTDCLCPVDLDGDGRDEIFIKNRERWGIVREFPDGLYLIWRSESHEELSVDTDYLLLAGSYLPGTAEQLFMLHEDDGVMTWLIFAWNAESSELEQIASQQGSLTDSKDGEIWLLTAGQRILAGYFTQSEVLEIAALSDNDLIVARVSGDRFETTVTFSGRVGGWSLSRRDEVLVTERGLTEHQDLLVKLGLRLGILRLSESSPKPSSIFDFDPDSQSLQRTVLFVRGDANGDQEVDLSDAIHLLIFLFQGGEKIHCLDAADADDSGQLDISDPIRILKFLFNGTFTIPVPGPLHEGTDPSPDLLDCGS